MCQTWNMRANHHWELRFENGIILCFSGNSGWHTHFILSTRIPLFVVIRGWEKKMHFHRLAQWLQVFHTEKICSATWHTIFSGWHRQELHLGTQMPFLHHHFHCQKISHIIWRTNVQNSPKTTEKVNLAHVLKYPTTGNLAHANVCARFPNITLARYCIKKMENEWKMKTCVIN